MTAVRTATIAALPAERVNYSWSAGVSVIEPLFAATPRVRLKRS